MPDSQEPQGVKPPSMEEIMKVDDPKFAKEIEEDTREIVNSGIGKVMTDEQLNSRAKNEPPFALETVSFHIRKHPGDQSEAIEPHDQVVMYFYDPINNRKVSVAYHLYDNGILGAQRPENQLTSEQVGLIKRVAASRPPTSRF